MDARDTLDLPLRSEALVKAVVTELPLHVRPWRQAIGPAYHALIRRVRICFRQVRTDSQHRLDGYRLGDHVIGVVPDLFPNVCGRLEEITNNLVVPLRVIIALLNRAPLRHQPSMNFVEQLRLQDPLVLTAAPSQTVDTVPQRAVRFLVQLIDNLRGETF